MTSMRGLRLQRFIVFFGAAFILSADGQDAEESSEDVLSDMSVSERDEIRQLMTRCRQTFPVELEDYIGKEVSRKAKCYLDCIVQDFPDNQDYGEMGRSIMESVNVTVPGDIGSDVTEQLAACIGDVETNVEDKCEASYQTFLCIMRMYEKIILFGLFLFV